VVIIGTIFAVLGAWYSMQRIPLDAIPDLSDVQVILYSEWMGRSPDLVEDQITYPIVTSLLAAPKVKAVRGYSMLGMSFVYVIFEDGTDLYWARSRVLEYMKQFEAKLPDGVAPMIGPDASSVGWVFQYALVDTGSSHSIADLRAYQDYNLQYALSAVPGVSGIASIGGFQKQYQVEVDPVKLQAYGLSTADVTGAIRRSNNEVGARVIEQAGREYFVRGRGYVQDLESLRKISLGNSPTGTPVLLGDVAVVSFGPDIRRGIGDLDGNGETVGGIVIMRHGENALDVIDRVKAKIAELAPSLPSGVTFKTVYDRSNLITRAIATLRQSLIEEMIVVAVVILIFLLHFGSALVPIITLPIAVGLAFIPMHFLGINSNIMSLGGIAIAIGAMVDASIVLVENAHKRLERKKPGESHNELVISAIQEVGPAIFYSLLIITVSFLPIFALTGQGGRLFAPLAYTKTFAMFFAAVLAITLAPALMTMFVRGKIRHEAEHPVSKFLIKLYKPFVFVALRNPKSTIAIGLLAIVATLPMIPKIGSEFMPPLNEGDILYMPTTMPNVSAEQARQSLIAQDRIIKSFPEVVSVYGKAGRAETPTDPAPLSMLETVVQLKPREEWRKVQVERWYSAWAPGFLKSPLGLIWPEERTITWEELVKQFDTAMQFPGWTNAWTMPIKTRIDMLSTGIRTPIGVKIFGNDLNEIERIGSELEQSLSRIPGTRSVFSERNTGGFYVDITPDRDALARYGLTISDVQDVIETAIGGTPIEFTVEGRNRFTINVRYPRELRESVDRIKQVLIPIGASAPAKNSGGMSGGMGAAPTMPEGPALASTDMSVAWGVFAQNQMNNMGSGGGAFPSGSPSSMPTTGQPPSSPGAPGQSYSPSRNLPEGRPSIPLGEIADVNIVTGPPMIKDEAGMLVGYVFVDIDQSQRDMGGYVDEAKEVVNSEITLPAGYHLTWTGQYEQLEEMSRRMKVAVPLALILVLILLYLNFRNITETMIVLCSVPFALVGSIWLMYFLGYNFSTATWVGIIALIGLAAETGIVMVLYLDRAYEKRKAAGQMNDLNDIIWAHMEGTVMRVRPKLMTVGTTLFGLIPLLWASGSGADVMKRIAAPMIGGLISSTFLTLEILPVIYTYWRYAQIKREKASPKLDSGQ
jgi:Cu(I)/Ag(I) efflux system membrane protein CusA/SilA